MYFLIHTEGRQTIPQQNLPLWHKDYLELKAPEKQHMYRQVSSKLPHLPKDRSSKGTQLSSIPPQGLHQPERLSLFLGEEPRSQDQTQRILSQTIISLIYSSKHLSSFLKIIYSPLKVAYILLPCPFQEDM